LGLSQKVGFRLKDAIQVDFKVAAKRAGQLKQAAYKGVAEAWVIL
jgi:hypothetical protein